MSKFLTLQGVTGAPLNSVTVDPAKHAAVELLNRPNRVEVSGRYLHAEVIGKPIFKELVWLKPPEVTQKTPLLVIASENPEVKKALETLGATISKRKYLGGKFGEGPSSVYHPHMFSVEIYPEPSVDTPQYCIEGTRDILTLIQAGVEFPGSKKFAEQAAKAERKNAR